MPQREATGPGGLPMAPAPGWENYHPTLATSAGQCQEKDGIISRMEAGQAPGASESYGQEDIG